MADANAMSKGAMPLRRCVWIFVVTWGLSACAAMPRGAATGSGTTSGQGGAAVRVHEPYATCAQALRGTRDGLRSLGFTIEDVEPAHGKEPGRVAAVRHSGWSAASPEEGEAIRVHAEIRCDDAGATVTADSEETGLARMRFPGQFREAYRAALARNRAPVSAAAAPSGRVDQRAVAERGLVVSIAPFPPNNTFPVADADPRAVGLLAFQVEIVNRTERRYAFDPAEVRMVTSEGRRRDALGASELRRRFAADGATAERLLDVAISAREIAPGESHSGFIYMEATGYRRATLRLTDVESGEAEGFSVPF